ncbi:MAG: V-type ATP synthase subunit D [Candidatus Geothermincolia bacterium]
MAGRLNVNPNRMELLKLRRRLAVARRGHHLLKEKLEELMKPFLAMVRGTIELRAEVEEELMRSYDLFTLARSSMAPNELEQALSHPDAEASVEVSRRPVVSVMAPEFHLDMKGDSDCYGLAATPAVLDAALYHFKEVLPRLLDLAGQENIVRMLALEIEKTRRRVNALEFVLIPQLEDSVRYITMKLDEFERSNLTRLMKIKQMVAESG